MSNKEWLLSLSDGECAEVIRKEIIHCLDDFNFPWLMFCIWLGQEHEGE